MKFLIHIPQLIYGGAEKVLVNFANYLVKKGHDVEILETYDKGFLKPQFDKRVQFNAICSREYTHKYYASLADIKKEKHLIKVIGKCMRLAFSKIVGYRKFAEKLSAKYYKNKEYDVAINYLEIEDPKFILDNIRAKQYIQWIHIDVSRVTIESAYIESYKRMDNIICVSEYAKTEFDKKYPFLKNKTTCIYNFFNVDEIIEKSLEKTIVYDGQFNIVSVGRMTTQKKYIRALDVISRLVKEGYNFKWYILGEGVEKEAIANKITKLGLNGVVELLGIKDNPYPYIKAANLFFLPSGWEGFPTVTIEAIVLERPVLATEVSGIREQVTDGVNGIIVENSEDGIYNGLKNILDNPQVLNMLNSNSKNKDILNNDIKYNKFMTLLK